MTGATRLLSPEEIAVQAGQQVPFLRLPVRSTVFAEREMRLRQRAVGHPMGDYLGFVAELAHAQQQRLAAHPEVPLPDAEAIESASRLGAPPLPAALWPRDPAWREGFRRILDTMLPRLSGSPAAPQLARLADADDAWLELQAGRLLDGVMTGLDFAAAPLVAAALQVYWTHLVIATNDTRSTDRLAPFGRVDDPTACPCCASRPTASVSRIGAAETGYRYLHCSLCNTQWHVVRIKCTHCQGTAGIHYHSLEVPGASAPGEAAAARQAQQAVEAETCDRCRHYLKIVHMERDAHVEPVADDLASITLDLLVAEAGFQRHGTNLLLLFGDAPEPSAEADGGGG